MPRLAYWPTAIMALQIKQRFQFLGFLAIPTCHDLVPHQRPHCHFMEHEIGNLIIPGIPSPGEIYWPRVAPRRSAPPARSVPPKLAVGIQSRRRPQLGPAFGRGLDSPSSTRPRCSPGPSSAAQRLADGGFRVARAFARGETGRHYLDPASGVMISRVSLDQSLVSLGLASFRREAPQPGQVKPWRSTHEGSSLSQAPAGKSRSAS